MKFRDFAEFLNEIQSLNSRNEITIRLAELLNRLDIKDVKPAMYLLQGRLVPKFVDTEFNFSEKLVLRALEEKFKLEVKPIFSKLGDVGLVAESLVQNSEKNRLPTISEIYGELEKLAIINGKGSQDAKLNQYISIVEISDPLSIRFITRVIVGNLRIGFSDKTVLDAFSWFLVGDKSLRKNIDSAFGSRSDLGELAEIVVKNKENKDIKTILENIKIKPGIPVASKLVEREKDSEGVWKRMPNCFVQPKLDGLRGQLHFSKSIDNEDPTIKLQSEDGTLSEIYSRNMESLTDQFPELLTSLKKLEVDSIILDSEIIGFDEENDKFFTYQETMQRRRKYDIESFSNTFPVKAMCFDILFLNGEDLTQKPIEERISLLKKIIDGAKKENGFKTSLDLLETIQMESVEDLEVYFKSKVENGLEGIITKEANSTYEPGTRNFKWIKLKANTRSDLVDTIDVAVLGYYSGGGGRAKFGFGAILAGVYDPKEDKYFSIGKVGSGFKEEDMPKIFEDMQKVSTSEIPSNYVVDKTLFPDVWVKPGIIMEIVADEITRSPNHTTARGLTAKVPRDDSSKGLSIRFPRIKIWNREDKDLPNTVEEIIRMYELRKG